MLFYINKIMSYKCEKYNKILLYINNLYIYALIMIILQKK